MLADVIARWAPLGRNQLVAWARSASPGNLGAAANDRAPATTLADWLRGHRAGPDALETLAWTWSTTRAGRTAATLDRITPDGWQLSLAAAAATSVDAVSVIVDHLHRIEGHPRIPDVHVAVLSHPGATSPDRAEELIRDIEAVHPISLAYTHPDVVDGTVLDRIVRRATDLSIENAVALAALRRPLAAAHADRHPALHAALAATTNDDHEGTEHLDELSSSRHTHRRVPGLLRWVAGQPLTASALRERAAHLHRSCTHDDGISGPTLADAGSFLAVALVRAGAHHQWRNHLRGWARHCVELDPAVWPHQQAGELDPAAPVGEVTLGEIRDRCEPIARSAEPVLGPWLVERLGNNEILWRTVAALAENLDGTVTVDELVDTASAACR